MHPNKSQLSQVLTEAQEEQFPQSGFVKLENAFPKAIAEQACAIFNLARSDENYSLVEQAIRLGLLGH